MSKTEAAAAAASLKACKLCEECKLKEWKYKCPACSFRSCSLPCVTSHKTRTLCSGKRNRTEFVPISQFDDNRLLSDYNLLEEIKRVGESAKRIRNKLSLYASFRPPFHLKSLRNAAYGRGTKLQFLPSGMSRREQNKTRYDQRKKCIYWTIEWRFHSANAVLLDHGIDENTNIASVIGKHLVPGPWNHQLKKFCDEGVDSLKFFIRKYTKGTKSPFYELDVKVPLRQHLANMLILEYPVVYVFLGSHIVDFEVLKQAPVTVHKHQQGSSRCDNNLSPRGVPFKEEVIHEEEDENSPSPRVFDMMKHPNSTTQNHSSNSSERVGAGGGSGLHSSTEAIEQLLFNEVDFDFDQGLIDAYSNLIAEINPDDFLDYEGLLPKQEERKESGCANGELLVESDELEEGEIIE